jgi:hypothetical protein
MKKIFFFLFLFVCFLYVFLDSEDTKFYKIECLKFGYSEKSKDYKECYKNTDNFFKYGLNYNVDKLYSKSFKFNENIKDTNKNILVNKNNYEEINFLDFIYKNFNTEASLTLKNKNILKKRVKFKMSILGLYSDNNIKFILPKHSKTGEKMFSGIIIDTSLKTEFQNTEIKSKFLKLFKNELSLDLNLRYLEHTVYGYFDDLDPSKKLEEIIGVRPVFYVEDIELSQAFLDKNKIRDILIKYKQDEKK